MTLVRRVCLRLGLVATASLLLSLIVMMFVVETPQVGTWFVLSALLAAGAYGTAVLAAYLER